MELMDINVDCLLQIFSFCSYTDLNSLCNVNSFFNEIIEQHIYPMKCRDALMCGYRNNPINQQRTHTRLTHGDRMKVAHNWLTGIYNHECHYYNPHSFPTKLHLEKDHLYLTQDFYLRKYKRAQHIALEKHWELEISTPVKTNIVDFVKKKDTIFSGRNCGTCYVYENGCTTEQLMYQSNEQLHCVDFVNNLYAISTNEKCKWWRRTDKFGDPKFNFAMQLECDYKTFKISQDCEWIYGGHSTDIVYKKALRALHIESGRQLILNSNTSSITDLKMKDEHIIFTTNSDTSLRMYDKRLDQDVSIWKDPFHSQFSCLEYDGLNAVLCRVQYDIRVNLCDIRMPKQFVQMYVQTYARDWQGKSAYSIACDSRYLFVANGRSVQVLDFKSNNSEKHDFGWFCYRQAFNLI